MVLGEHQQHRVVAVHGNRGPAGSRAVTARAPASSGVGAHLDQRVLQVGRCVRSLPGRAIRERALPAPRLGRAASPDLRLHRRGPRRDRKRPQGHGRLQRDRGARPRARLQAQGRDRRRLVRRLLSAALHAGVERADVRFGLRLGQGGLRHRAVHRPARLDPDLRRDRPLRADRDPAARVHGHPLRVAHALQPRGERSPPLSRDRRRRRRSEHGEAAEHRRLRRGRLEQQSPHGARRRLSRHLLRRVRGRGRVAARLARAASSDRRQRRALPGAQDSGVGALRPVLGRTHRSGGDPQFPPRRLLQLGPPAHVRDLARGRLVRLQEPHRRGARGSARRAHSVVGGGLRFLRPAPVRDRRLAAQRERSVSRHSRFPRRADPGRGRVRRSGVRARQAPLLRAQRAAGRMARSRDADRGRQHAGRRARRHLLGPHATDRGARRGGSAAGDRPGVRLPPYVPERGCDQAGRARGHHARHRRGSRAQQLHRPRQPVQAGRRERVPRQ